MVDPSTLPRRTDSPRNTAELVKDLVGGTQALVREEVQLAKIELQENLKSKVVGGGMFAVIAVLGLYLIGFLGLAIGAGLSRVMPDWAAWLVMAGIFLLLIVILAVAGRSRLQGPAAPEAAIERMKEDVAWAKQTFKRS